jgi:hypothetical protein
VVLYYGVLIFMKENLSSFEKEDKYHLTKYGVEYIVRVHSTESRPSLISAGQIKRAINACKNLVFMILKTKELDKSNSLDALNPLHKNEMLEMRRVF